MLLLILEEIAAVEHIDKLGMGYLSGRLLKYNGGYLEI